MILDIAADVVAVAASAVAVVYAMRAERRLRRERARTDRLYKNVDLRIAEHIRSRLH